MRLKISTAFVFTCLILLISPTSSFGADLLITDSNDNEFTVKNVIIDYTKYPSSFGFYTKDFERNGIRAIIGDGVTTIYWKNIKEIRKTSIYKAIVHLNSGNKKEVTLLHESKKGLAGETELGHFEIKLSTVKKIEVISP